jgi:hypothetical protein
VCPEQANKSPPDRESYSKHSGPAGCYQHRGEALIQPFLRKRPDPMPDTTHNIRQLPIYIEGFSAGQDVGLRIALDAITQERIRQTLLQDTYPGNPAEAFRHHSCAGRLVDVSKVIGARFRQ